MSHLRHLVVLAAAGSLSCTTSATLREPPGTSVAGQDRALLVAAQDTALLTAVVRAVQSDRRAYKMIVDPRPLLPEVEDVVSASFARIPRAVLQAREDALRNMRVEPGDALALGQNARCPGISVRPERAGHDPHAQCPQERLYVVAIALPRPGTARPPAGQVYHTLSRSAAEGYWAVRVIGTTVGPEGSALKGYDYVLKKEGAGWTFVGAVPLYDFH
jgi:hypothetical protein